MTDVLFLCKPSDWGYDEELRYALRSLAMYGTNVGRVYVVGNKPDFLSDEVTYISCDNPYDRKAKNMQYRIEYAMLHSDIGDRFLWSSDDIYHTREIDLDRYPKYWKNAANILDSVGNNTWNNIMQETSAFMQRYGLSQRDFSGGHCFHWWDSDTWSKNVSLFAKAMNTKYGIPPANLMGALYNGAEVRTRCDIKINKSNTNLGACFSIAANPQNWGGDIILSNLFKNKCRYEK